MNKKKNLVKKSNVEEGWPDQRLKYVTKFLYGVPAKMEA